MNKTDENSLSAVPASLHENYMRRCIQLAKAGQLTAAPNPVVGAVVVAQGRIIGEGFHIRAGQAHAEVNAIGRVSEADRHLLAEATLYVSLEPCSHYGRTPPCARLIIDTGIRRVVVGCTDPYEEVSGRGVRMLEEAGVEVLVGVLENECRALNRHFFAFHLHHRPFVTLKWACSRDGFLDAWREDGGAPARLSTPLTQAAVHHLRAVHQAILVGHSTLRLDHPRLDVRHWAGQNPLPVVLGRAEEGELPAGWQCFSDIETLLSSLHAQKIQALLVEGGALTLQSFIDAGLWDEAWEEHSDVCLGSGVPAPRMPVGVPHDLQRRFGVTFGHWTNTDESLA